jgi:Oxidoreductase FAD-binding domain
MAEMWANLSSARIAAPASSEEPYQVVEIEGRTPTICELWLRPAGDRLEYLAGEYVLLEDRDHQVPPRSYSIANAPRSDGMISLLVTRVPGGETSTWALQSLAPAVCDQHAWAGSRETVKRAKDYAPGGLPTGTSVPSLPSMQSSSWR